VGVGVGDVVGFSVKASEVLLSDFFPILFDLAV
jgi:hypothetical protein